MKFEFYDKDKKPFLVESNTKIEAINTLLNPHKKPNYRFSIYNKLTKKLVINPETNMAFFFEYPSQANKHIKKNLGDSKIFEIWGKKNE